MSITLLELNKERPTSAGISFFRVPVAHKSNGNRWIAYAILDRLLEAHPTVRDNNYLPNYKIREIDTERRERRRHIELLEERIRKSSPDYREQIVAELKMQSQHQHALRLFRRLVNQDLNFNRISQKGYKIK